MAAGFLRRVWTRVGVASLIGTVAPLVLPLEASAQHAGKGHGPQKTETPAPPTAVPGPAARKDQIAQPQGGEAYLTDGGPKDTRIRIYRDIALMRGHLLVGGELIEMGLWDEALPHFLHPSEELYGAMERYIKLHKVPPFDRQLQALAQAVKAKNKPAYLQAAKVVDQRITVALDAFQKFMVGQPFSSYTARTLAELAKVAQSEYEAAIENGRFTKPVEYQDSRGFMAHAAQLIERHADDFSTIDAVALDVMRSRLADLRRAWPDVLPPDKPVLEPTDLAAKVEGFIKATERFH